MRAPGAYAVAVRRKSGDVVTFRGTVARAARRHPALKAPLVRGVVALFQSLAGGVAAFLVMLLPWAVYPEGMGGGDVKLAALVGLATGFPLSLLALFISFLGGGLVGGLLLLSGVKGRKDPIPFGPFLSVAAMAAFFWGDALAAWYWHSLRLQ